VKGVARRDWSAQDERELKKHSKTKTPVTDISKALKRTVGALTAFAMGALKANGFQNIQKTASEVTGTHGGTFAAITCFGTQPKHTAMIMIFGNSDAANLSTVDAVRTKIGGYAPL
jgi:hypothetical protein